MCFQTVEPLLNAFECLEDLVIAPTLGTADDSRILRLVVIVQRREFLSAILEFPLWAYIAWLGARAPSTWGLHSVYFVVP